MDELDVLDLTVEQLVSTVKTTWVAKSIGYDYEHRVDFDEEVEGDSKEDVIEKMVNLLIRKNTSYPEEINLSVILSLRIPIQDEDDFWWFKEFSHVEKIGHLTKADVKKLPYWQEKVVKAAEEKAAAEKLIREQEEKIRKEEQRKRDLATYERIKKELESS